MHERVEGVVKHLCYECYAPIHLSENGTVCSRYRFKQLSREMSGRTKLTLREIADTAFG